MDPNTLTLYLVAGGLSLSLSLVLWMFAYLHRGTRLLKSIAVAIVVLSVGFTISGLRPVFPLWMIVMGTNMLLISAGAVLYAGFEAYYAERQPVFDRWGWGLVVLTAIPFWYWGLVEPDGLYRAAVFSFATAVINGRTALLLLRAVWKPTRTVPVSALAALFAILTVWMAVRGALSLVAEPVPPGERGANPTAWTTVFWYIVLVTMMTACSIWMELSRPKVHRQEGSEGSDGLFSVVEYFRNKLLLLWATVLILVLGVLGESGLFYTKAFEWEEARLTQVAEVTNDAFVHHSMQVISQVDTLLNSVRSFYQHTSSVAETERFINTLPFDRSTIDNVYLIDAQGRIVVSHDPAAIGRSVADRDYFVFHQALTGDPIYIGSVESGRVTGRFHFRVVRRISAADGSFAGVVLATVDPESFTRYYQQLAGAGQNTAALIGTMDRKLRARSPMPPADRWQVPLESPLWGDLVKANTGHYQSTSTVDRIRRIFAYKKVGDFPLVMVTGFSQSDIRSGVQERFRWWVAGTLAVLVVVLILAILLTIEIRRRNEQNRFLSMLSHELKTPLSVLRIAMGSEGALSATTRKHAQQSVQDMDAIIERCLQVDRIAQGRYATRAQPCRVGEMLAELQTAHAPCQRIAVSADGLLPVTVDEHLLRIALSNLVENALKYSPTASVVRVAASNHVHKGQPGILVQVANAVGSAGVPDASKVFRKYYRSPQAHSKTESGLGLYLVRTAAAQLDGWVRLVPSETEVCFEFWVPL